MIERVSYKRVVCDICGREERIDQSRELPPEWEELRCGCHFRYHCCPECIQDIKIIIEDSKKKNPPLMVQITKDGHIYELKY